MTTTAGARPNLSTTATSGAPLPPTSVVSSPRRHSQDPPTPRGPIVADGKYVFDCFVCEERYEGNDLQRLIAFMKPHEKCGVEEADRG
jgi:hypothetical protein